MSRILSAALVATLATPALAVDRQESFTRDGVTYTYFVTDQGDAQLITGSNSFKEKFKLKVKNGRITGYVDSRPVAFRAKTNLAGDVKMAAR